MKVELKKTPFLEMHKKYNAKLIDFGGWFMPVQYESIIEEHRLVREKVGVFDVSHMGEVEVWGDDYIEWTNNIVTNDVSKLAVGQVLYSPMCYADGGIVDDLLVYRYEDHILLVVNASNTDKDFKWLKYNKTKKIKLKNISNKISQLAIQGPKSQDVMQKLTDVNLDEIKFYWFKEAVVAGEKMLISRTGYTVEDGFEIYFDNEYADKVWNAIMEAGKEFDIAPIGLGARDSLRFEVCYPLYGNELTKDINPIEASLNWTVKMKKEQFNGKHAIAKTLLEGVEKKLIGLEIEGRLIPRHGFSIYKGDKKIGFISTGLFSPSLQKPLALGYVSPEYAVLDSEVSIAIRKKMVKAKIVERPFYKNGSRK